MKVSETTPVNSQTYMKRQQKIEGEGHGPLLPPSKDGRLPSQNLPQSVTPKTVTDRKEDKQGTQSSNWPHLVRTELRAGGTRCALRSRSRGLTPTRLMKRQSHDKRLISQASSARRESIYAENPGVTHDTAQADLCHSQPHSDLMASFVVPTDHPTTTTCVERRTGQ